MVGYSYTVEAIQTVQSVLASFCLNLPLSPFLRMSTLKNKQRVNIDTTLKNYHDFIVLKLDSI